MYIPAVSGGQNAPHLQTYQPEQKEPPDFSSGYAPYYHDKKPSGIDSVEAVRVMAHLIPGMTEIPPEGKRKLMDTLLRYGQEQRENQAKERNTQFINTYVRPAANTAGIALGAGAAIAGGVSAPMASAAGGAGLAASNQLVNLAIQNWGTPRQYKSIPHMWGVQGKEISHDIGLGMFMEAVTPYGVAVGSKALSLVEKPLGAAGKTAIRTAEQFLKKLKGRAGGTAAESEAAAPLLSAADDLLPAQPYAAYHAAGTETSAGVDTIRESMGNEAFQRFMKNSPTFRHMALTVAENPAMASNPVVKGSMENVIRSTAGEEGVKLFRAQLRREAVKKTKDALIKQGGGITDELGRPVWEAGKVRAAIPGKKIAQKVPGQPTWREHGRTDLRHVPSESHLPTPERLPWAATRREAVEILEDALGFKEGMKLVEIKTPVETVRIDRQYLPHIVRKDAREQFANFVRPTLESPFEVYAVKYNDGSIRRHYIGLFDGNKGMHIIVRETENGGLMWNYIESGSQNINRYRVGELLYHR